MPRIRYCEGRPQLPFVILRTGNRDKDRFDHLYSFLAYFATSELTTRAQPLPSRDRKIKVITRKLSAVSGFPTHHGLCSIHKLCNAAIDPDQGQPAVLSAR